MNNYNFSLWISMNWSWNSVGFFKCFLCGVFLFVFVAVAVFLIAGTESCGYCLLCQEGSDARCRPTMLWRHCVKVSKGCNCCSVFKGAPFVEEEDLETSA
ncbi:hypothetical protein BV898_08187 [Hypsibius exemplaris]|uniref:Uncharacterized protein n=1 Tax=Hypsibius exemplaris TaxID=2072580 RepID=A0A1W0WRA4_HYPEX|nr:hypothetical protein BV898_08187 [Hypsibius exemplaris]